MAEEQLYEWHSDSSGAVKADDAYVISTDRSRLDIDVIHDFLTHSYWGAGWASGSCSASSIAPHCRAWA